MVVAEEKEEDARENYNNLQQEVDIKTRKLKKLYSKLQNTKAEIDDIQEEHRNRMRDLEQTVDQLTRETKLCSLLVDNFIPPGDVTKVENRAEYDEEREVWHLKPIATNDTMMKRPESAVGNKRPVSRYAMAKADQEEENPRYKCENVLQLELDMPTRTTRDWEGPDPELASGASLLTLDQDQAHIEMDEIVIQASPTIFKPTARSQANGRPKTGKGKKSSRTSVVVDENTSGAKRNSQQFPTSRGLVPR